MPYALVSQTIRRSQTRQFCPGLYRVILPIKRKFEVPELPQTWWNKPYFVVEWVFIFKKCGVKNRAMCLAG